MRRVLLIGGAAIMGCLVFGGLVIGLVFFATGGVAQAGDDFLAALRDEQYTDAFDLLGRELQAELGSPDQLEAFFTDLNLPIDTWRYTSRNVNNNEGELSGRVEGGGRSATVQLFLLNENDAWKIVGFRFEPEE